MNLPDHGRDIANYDFSELTKFQRSLEEASGIVSSWPAWKRGVLNKSMEANNPEPRKVKIF